jgi:hypothetical protein
VTPLEDFTTEALAIAINHDPRPFVRMLERIPAADWAPRSSRPEFDWSTVAVARAKTQQYLVHRGLDGGRLDLVVTMGTAEGPTATVWVEVKIEAPPTTRTSSSTLRDQFDVYFDHRPYHSPRPVLLALTKYRLARQDVTWVAWDDLVRAVGTVSDVDRSWTDLVEFLCTREVVIPPLPSRPDDYRVLLPVFRAVDARIRDLWPGGSPTLYWAPGVDRAVRWIFKNQPNPLLTGGPLRYGLVRADDGWRWRIAVATGSDYYQVHVTIDAVVDAAHHGGIPEAWVRSADEDAVLLQERPFEPGGSTTDVSDWLTAALEQLSQAGVLEPYLEAMRTKTELRTQGRAKNPLKEGADRPSTTEIA